MVPTVPIATPIITPFFQGGLLKSSKKFSKKPNASSKTKDMQKIKTKEFHYMQSFKLGFLGFSRYNLGIRRRDNCSLRLYCCSSCWVELENNVRFRIGNVAVVDVVTVLLWSLYSVYKFLVCFHGDY